MSKSFSSVVIKGGLYAAWIVAIGVVLFPIYWIVAGSFKHMVDLFAYPPVFLFRPTLRNFQEAFATAPFLKYFINSLVIASSSVGAVILLAVPAGYSLSRFRIRGGNQIAIGILLVRMIPSVNLIIPLYMLFQKTRLLDTCTSVILCHTLFNLPLGIWLLRGYFASISTELEEAALIDGCSRIGAFLRISLPLARAGIAVTGALCFIFSWNELLYAVIMTSRESVTLPVALASFVTFEGVLYGQIFAAAMIMILPMIILAFMIWKHFVAGISLGATVG